MTLIQHRLRLAAALGFSCAAAAFPGYARTHWFARSIDAVLFGCLGHFRVPILADSACGCVDARHRLGRYRIDSDAA